MRTSYAMMASSVTSPVEDEEAEVDGVRTYVSHLLGTYVTILCNWLVL